MSELDAQGKRLLAWLVSKVTTVVPGDPRTYVGYKDAHDDLGLPLLGATHGQSLQRQGLTSLNEWTVANQLPGITGLLVAKAGAGAWTPGEGYFRSYGKTPTDFAWWENQIRQAKAFDWAPYLASAPLSQAPDEWVRQLRQLATNCGVALSDAAVSSEGIYE